MRLIIRYFVLSFLLLSASSAYSLPLSLITSVIGFVSGDIVRTMISHYFHRRMARDLHEQAQISPFKKQITAMKVRVDKVQVPDYVHQHAQRFWSEVDNAPHEGNVLQFSDYLRILEQLPWHESHQVRYRVDDIKKRLDLECFGLEQPKDILLDYLCMVRRAPQDASFPVLCLVGEPGVGKTAFAQSVGRALGIPCSLVSLAGMSNPDTFFRGSNRVYRGAHPGKFVELLMRTGINNSVVILDEIDKAAGGTEHGRTVDLLLEVFDRKQNKRFLDHFLDLGIDVSKILFITTANDETKIPKPLLDRMILVRVPTYSYEEKRVILRDYIWPRVARACILKVSDEVRDHFVEEVVKKYPETSGIRQLEQDLYMRVMRDFRHKQE